VTLAEVDEEFVKAHEMMQPFGAGNLQPLFLTRNANVTATREFAPDCCELTLDDGSGRAAAVLWPSVKALACDARNGATIDLLFHIEPDSYAASGAKLTIVDARASVER
jgi:single-stranded DNA-specific DHH superfamily exonuclease